MEAWLINMNKYFQLYEYDYNLKALLAIFQLQGKATLWWEEVKTVHEVNEQSITWDKFQKFFKEKYLTERFYDEKAKEFHDLCLGQMTMDEFITKFTSLLRCVPYIREEKAKVQWFVSGLPLFMKERLDFDNPKTMDEVIRKARIYYQQNKPKGDMSKRWADKKGNKFISSHKGNKNNSIKGLIKGQGKQNMSKPIFKAPGEAKTSEQAGKNEAELVNRPPVQC